ncbi:MAG: glycosyltransferase family A protein [Bryobacteraceae bacterium]
MGSKKISVIAPVYNGGEYIGGAIESVLSQTYPYFELILVDDGSSDSSIGVIKRFSDKRIKLIEHGRNRGADFARKTGLHASSGEIVAFLDQDDRFTPDKLEAHVKALESCPDVGFTYNPFFWLSHPSETVVGLYRPPDPLRLIDLISGFPLPPSVWVMRRQWALREDVWEEGTLPLQGREVIFCGRLFLAGCKFGLVNRALNYRRIQREPRRLDIVHKYQAERQCQEAVLRDSRCPGDVAAQAPLVYANKCLAWAYCALLQQDIESGWALLREALQLDPGILAGAPSGLVGMFLAASTMNCQVDHEAQLRVIADRLPPELGSVRAELEWAVAPGYLLRGFRSVMWGRGEEGTACLRQGVAAGAVLDERCIQIITHELMSFEAEYGAVATQTVLLDFSQRADGILDHGRLRILFASYCFNRALQAYSGGARRLAVTEMFRAMLNRPQYASNRGAWAVMFRSLVGMRKGILNRTEEVV